MEQFWPPDSNLISTEKLELCLVLQLLTPDEGMAADIAEEGEELDEKGEV